MGLLCPGRWNQMGCWLGNDSSVALTSYLPVRVRTLGNRSQLIVSRCPREVNIPCVPWCRACCVLWSVRLDAGRDTNVGDAGIAIVN